MTTAAPDPAALERRVATLDRGMRAHAGGVEVASVDDGTVTVRFRGMCTGCLTRPLCLTATVRPGLLAIDGVREVRAQGWRMSEEAERRVADLLADTLPTPIPAPVDDAPAPGT